MIIKYDLFGSLIHVNADNNISNMVASYSSKLFAAGCSLSISSFMSWKRATIVADASYCRTIIAPCDRFSVGRQK